MVKSPTASSVSALLARTGFGRNTKILGGRTTLPGFKVSRGFRVGTVVVLWSAGSDFDGLGDDEFRNEMNRQWAHMLPLYAGVLEAAGYSVRSNGNSVIVSAPEPSTPKPSIHAKCLKFRDEEGVMLICSKSEGHTAPRCYDPDEDRHFFPQN